MHQGTVFCVFFFPSHSKKHLQFYWTILTTAYLKGYPWQGYPSEWEGFLTYQEAESLCYRSKLILPNTECQNYLLPLENFTKMKHLSWVCLPLRQQKKLKEAILLAALLHQEPQAYPVINRCLELAHTSKRHLMWREGVNMGHFLIFFSFT